MTAVQRARDRVWLIDGFLLKIDQRARANFFEVFERALGNTSGAQEIHLITSPKEGHREQIESLRRLQDARRAPPGNEPFTIEVRLGRDGKSSLRLPHDRFAIIDDELWHWGANEGEPITR